MVDFAKLEEEANLLIGSGEKGKAIKAVYELALASARAKDFVRAERWKQQLYQLDAMALTEIIDVGEAIEAEKAGGLDQSYLDLWPQLFQSLTGEETNALYYALQEKVFAADEVVFEQGNRHARLYFIVSGQLKLIHATGNREHYLQGLNSGDIAGVDTFFTISTCTTSLVTLSPVKVRYLERDVMDGWQEQFPGLERKLHDFCLGLNKIPELLKRKGLDRRTQTRYPVEGIAVIDLLNATGVSLGREFRGKLADISEGGVSFFIRTSKRETARLLLGRRITFSLGVNVPVLPEKFSRLGRITSVVYHLFKDYSVHVRFDEPLSVAVVQQLVANLKDEKYF
jgi:CRP-like cAMP-binding protein